jgi:aminoglycoside 6'-N-acetyltransferase
MPTRPSVQVRPAAPGDFEAMVDLELASAEHHAALDPDGWRVPARADVAAFARERLASDPERAALVATVDREVVGMVEIAMLTPGHPGGAIAQVPSADLGITVAPAWRGRGVGGELMRAAERWALDHGARRMVLDMAAANAGARRFYERLGYEVHGLLMRRSLSAAVEPGSVEEPRSIPTLRGDRVVLRPLRAQDRERLIEVLADPTVATWWDTRGPDVSADELLADDEVTPFAVDVDGELIGSIQYAEEGDPDYRHAGIDIFLASTDQGRGFGTDALRTLARYLLEVRGHHRLTIDPAAANERAIHTYAKIGFRPVGVMRQYERGRDGTFHDGLLMDLLAGELR